MHHFFFKRIKRGWFSRPGGPTDVTLAPGPATTSSIPPADTLAPVTIRVLTTVPDLPPTAPDAPATTSSTPPPDTAPPTSATTSVPDIPPTPPAGPTSRK